VEHLDDAWRVAHLPEFTSEHTARFFVRGVVLAGAPYLLLRALWAREEGASAVTRVHGSWVVLYLAFLGAGGGALWPRYFLPLVPSVLALSAAGLAALHDRKPALCWIAVLLLGLTGLLWCGTTSAVMRTLGDIEASHVAPGHG
jgi:hypothetical protein